MSNNYPPQGEGQPNQPPSSPYGPPPNPAQFGQPPVPPTMPGTYAPPPGVNPNQYNPAPPPGQPYPVRPYGAPAKKKNSLVGRIVLVVVVVAIIGGVVAGILGVFNNVDANDYPGATKASLTDKGTTYVNGLYQDKSSDRDNRKVFVTADTPDKVFAYYKSDLVSKGWTFDTNGDLNGISASQFLKSGKVIIVIAGTSAEGLIKDEGTQNFIIVVTGDDTTS